MELIRSSCFGGLLLILSFCFSTALTPSTFLTNADQQRLKKVLTSAIPPTELTTAHYAVLGFSHLGEIPPSSEELCKFFDSKVDTKKIDTIFHASSGSKLLKNCKLSVAGLQQTLDNAIAEDSSMQDIYHSVLSLKNLNLKVDSNKIAKVLKAALKKDDSVINLGYAFHVASVLTPKTVITPFFERIEDVIVQADEVDGKYLQFEGGLGITATTISGVYKISEVIQTAPALTADQAIKFTNYFLSRKFVQTVKGAAQLLEVLKIFASNKFHIPVAVTLASNSALSDENPNVQVRITNVLGASLGPLTVTAENVQYEEKKIALAKNGFEPVKGSNILYSLNFLNTKPLRGFYTISINAVASKADPKLIGNTGAEVNVKVMTEVDITNAVIATAFIDQVSSAKSTSITYPKESVNLDVDTHQKMLVEFTLKDKNAKSYILTHQAFIMLANQKTKQEVVFVFEHDNSGNYKFDLNFKAREKEFGSVSGLYNLHIIVGDAVLKNPFIWKVGQVKITFPTTPSESEAVQSPYEPKPEIKHMFREKEKTPSSLVSNTFSALCALPLLLLIISWISLGANLSNFPCSIYAAGFHLGLLGIFGLFLCFWVHLSMFSTLKYLCGLGIFTFITGHKLLSKLASRK